jgi:Fe-S oxidoreductase
MISKKDDDVVHGTKETDSLVRATNVLFCLDCGKCTATCPVSTVRSGFSPRRIVETAMMENMKGVDSDRYLWDCLTCGKCTNYCPEEVRFMDFVRGQRERAIAKGNASVMNHGGITYSIASAMAGMSLEQKRLSWTEGVKVARTGDILLFTGCMVYFDKIFSPLGIEGGRNILWNAVKILNKAGIVPAVMDDEVCCGHDQGWSGDTETLMTLGKRNIEAIKRTKAKRIVTVCPECANTLKQDYRQLLGVELDVIHITEFIAQLVKDSKIKMKRSGTKVTYHDPCRLVQHLGIIDAPREVITAISGEGFVEMKDSHELASCCGTTLFRNCDVVSEMIRIERLRQAQATETGTLLTACPKCQIHFKCTLSGKCEEKGLDPKLEVKDFVTYVAENMEG